MGFSLSISFYLIGNVILVYIDFVFYFKYLGYNM